MKTYYIRTAGSATNSDYIWQNSARENAATLEINKFPDSNNLSFAIFCCEDASSDSFSIYIGGFHTGQHDFRNRSIRLDFAIKGLSESEARHLMAHAMRNLEKFAKQLFDCIKRDVLSKDQSPQNSGEKGKGNPDWQVDFEKIKKIIDPILANLQGDSSPSSFPERKEGYFAYKSLKPDEEEAAANKKSLERLKKLADQLETTAFSKNSGLKLLVSPQPTSEGHERALDEADIYLWQGGPATERTIIKKNYPPSFNQKKRTAGNSSNIPSFRLSNPALKRGLILGIGLLSMAVILYILSSPGSSKKKATITRIDLDNAAPNAFVVHFDRPMDTNVVPRIFIPFDTPVYVEKLRWQDPTTLKFQVSPPGRYRIQIENGRTAEGGKLQKYTNEIPSPSSPQD